jgi:hypothetical protein
LEIAELFAGTPQCGEPLVSKLNSEVSSERKANLVAVKKQIKRQVQEIL